MSGWPVLAAILLLVPLWRIQGVQAEAASPLFWGGLLIVAIWIGARDRWAGAFALYSVVRGMLSPPPFAWNSALAIIGGITVLVVAQTATPRGQRVLHAMLAGAGIVQVLLVAMQWWQLPPGERLNGSIGNSWYAGNFLAITGATAPGWALPLFGLGILLTQARLAALAFYLVITIRYPKGRLPALGFGLLLVGLTIWRHGANMDSVAHRLWILGIAFEDFLTHPLALLFGFGLGAWPRRMLFLQRDTATAFSELFGQAHNDYLDIVYAGGLVGLGFVAAWVWSQRAVVSASPMRSAAVAIALLATASFIMQAAATAVAALTVLGLASAPQRGACACCDGS